MSKPNIPLELIDIIFGYSSIDTKMALRKLYPNFKFTVHKIDNPLDPWGFFMLTLLKRIEIIEKRILAFGT